MNQWSEANIKSLSDLSSSYDIVHRDMHTTAYARTFEDHDYRTHVRPDYNRQDYDSFRGGSAVPTTQKEIIKACQEAYKDVGILRNIIDLMGDFACQGVGVVHRNKSAESFFKQYFRYVNGKERSERFLNNLYRSGNVVVYRSYGNLTKNAKQFMDSLASDIKFDIPDVTKNRVPLKYTFFNPLKLDVGENGDLYLDPGTYMKLNNNTKNSFVPRFQTNSIPESVLKQLPQHLQKDIKGNKPHIKLEPERLAVFHYKKDDWEQWADPLIRAILDDVIMLKKMRLADLSALDGATSNIRHWKIGNLEYQIIPSEQMIDKLRGILNKNVGGGAMELVTGPEVSFDESSTELHKFLGSEKYSSVLSAIYAGLGVPPTLTGIAGNGGGFTNNFISLKTLVERLQYGRDLLVSFWEEEFEMVRRAMGFRYAPEITFDQMSLSDEAAEKNLLIQLSDRGLISNETILERFKESPNVEKVRVQREESEREAGAIPEKASPFHQVKEEGAEDQEEVKDKGRPFNSKDGEPRKKRVETPKSTPGVAEVMIWADAAWDQISDTVNSAYLASKGKSNLRQLTKAQANSLEWIKARVMTNVSPLKEFGPKEISNLMRAQVSVASEINDKLKEYNISPENMSIDLFRKNVIGMYVQTLISR